MFNIETTNHEHSIEFTRPLLVPSITYNDNPFKYFLSRIDDIVREAGYNAKNPYGFVYSDAIPNMWIKVYIDSIVIEDTVFEDDIVLYFANPDRPDPETALYKIAKDIKDDRDLIGKKGYVLIRLQKPIVVKIDKKRQADITVDRPDGRKIKIKFFLNIRKLYLSYGNFIKLFIRARSNDDTMVRCAIGYIKGSIRKVPKPDDIKYKIKELMKEYREKIHILYTECHKLKNTSKE